MCELIFICLKKKRNWTNEQRFLLFFRVSLWLPRPIRLAGAFPFLTSGMTRCESLLGSLAQVERRKDHLGSSPCGFIAGLTSRTVVYRSGEDLLLLLGNPLLCSMQMSSGRERERKVVLLSIVKRKKKLAGRCARARHLVWSPYLHLAISWNAAEKKNPSGLVVLGGWWCQQQQQLGPPSFFWFSSPFKGKRYGFSHPPLVIMQFHHGSRMFSCSFLSALPKFGVTNHTPCSAKIHPGLFFFPSPAGL